jgi:hypothetical protein
VPSVPHRQVGEIPHLEIVHFGRWSSGWGGGGKSVFFWPRHPRRNVQAEALPPPLPGGNRPRCPRGARVHRVLGHDGRAAASGGRSPNGCLYSRGPQGVFLLSHHTLPTTPTFSISPSSMRTRRHVSSGDGDSDATNSETTRPDPILFCSPCHALPQLVKKTGRERTPPSTTHPLTSQQSHR